MKKNVALIALAASLATLSFNAQAASSTGTFNVVINLTSACVYTKTADVTFNYTSFQAAAATATPGGFYASVQQYASLHTGFGCDQRH